MSISFSGLASGLDTSSWVESLVALKKAKVTTLEEEKKEVQSLQKTLTQIKSFFSSFRSMLEKVTDAKFGIASMDLFAQNLATSSNLEALTASATTEAEEATYNVLVDKLASETKANSNYSYMTTIVQTTTATGDSKLINLGVKTGTIGVTVKSVEHGISITENDTLSTFIEKLKNIGVNASFNEDSGIFSIDVSADAINDRYEGTTVDKTGIKDALHLRGVNEGYKSDNLTTSRTDTIFSAATETTKLSELGVKDGIVTITANSANYSITINGTTTLGEFIEELNKKHIDATLDKDGVFTISDAEITNEGTTDIKNALGLNSSIFGKTQVTGNLTHQTTITQTTLATSGTLLKDLEGGKDIKDGDTVIVKNSNNEYTTITVGTTTTLGKLVEGLSKAGLYAAVKSDGTMEITGGTIEGGSFKAEDVLGLTREPYSAIVTGKPLTETVEVHKLVDLQTKLVDDLKVKEGYLEVTDANGNKYYEKIYSGQTIADFMTDMGNLGIQTSLDEETGVLTITGGAFKTLSDADVKALVANATIVEPDTRYQQGTNLLACLYGADTISTDQITVASTYSKTKALRHTVTNTINATKNTTLDKLGLSADGTATFDVRGESRTINLTTTMTISDLMNQLKDAGIGSSFNEDTSRLTIENATITGGTSDLATVLDLTTTISGKYVTSSELYVSDTITVDATRNTLLKYYGISDTMSEADRTVTIFDNNGGELGSTIVNEGTSIGDLLDWINGFDSVSANLKDGFLTINGGYITNNTLETSMGLTRNTKETSVIGSVMTITTSAAVTGETTLGSIFSALGTLDKVKDGYNLKFNNKDIEVSASTTLNQLINAIYENGGTASLDHTGRLSIEGGTVTGSVAQALGITSYTHTSSVSATGEKLYVTENVYADRNTKLSDLGITNDTASYTIYNSLGEATTTVTLNTTTTIGDFLDGLKANGIDGIIANGVIKLDSAEGKYIQGALPTALGLTTQTVTEVVSTTQMSTAQVKHTATLNADLATTMGELGVADPDNVFNIYDKNDQLLASYTITDASTTIQDFFNNLKTYDIIGSINNGVISLYSPSGNYIAGTLADKLGIATEAGANRTMTVGTTVTSTIAVTYTQDVKATEDMLLGDFISIPQDTTVTTSGTTTVTKGTVTSTITDKNGNVLGTISVDNTTTFGNLFQKLGEYGIDADIHDGVIKLTSPEGNIISGGIADALGIATQTITTTKTVGASVTSTAVVTYTSSVLATGTTTLGTLLDYTIDGTITASGVTGNVIGISTADELKYLAALSKTNSFEGKTFVLTNDITLNATEKWEGIGSEAFVFKGTFDGQGHTIKNVQMGVNMVTSSSGQYFGFFNYANAKIKNITLSDAVYNISTSNVTLGGLVGKGNVEISNATMKNFQILSTTDNNTIGGFLGYGSGELDQCIIDMESDTSKIYVSNYNSNIIIGGIIGQIAPESSTSISSSQAPLLLDPRSSNFNGTFGFIVGQITNKNSTFLVVLGNHDTNVQISDCYSVGGLDSGTLVSKNAGGIVGRVNINSAINSNPGHPAYYNLKLDINHCYSDTSNNIKGFIGAAYSDNSALISNNLADLYASIRNSITSSNMQTYKTGNHIHIEDSNSLYGSSGNYDNFENLGFNSTIWNFNTGNIKQDTNPYSLNIYNPTTGDAVLGTVLSSTTTMDDLMNILNLYGTATLTNGVLTFKGNNGTILSGNLAKALGIKVQNMGSVTTTVAATATSTTAVTYTEAITATASTQLGQLSTYIIDGTITASGVTGTVIGISTARDLVNLQNLSQTQTFNGKTFVLTADIDMSSISNWKGIGNASGSLSFSGKFDGQGHTISNLKENNTNMINGLFNTLSNTEVKNITLENFTFTVSTTSSWKSIGALAGQANDCNISNINVRNFTITDSAACTNVVYGGITGSIKGTIINSTTSGSTIIGNWTGFAGGITGCILGGNASKISSNSSNINIATSDTSDNWRSGGIVGYIGLQANGQTVNIDNCLYNGSNVQTGIIGGIFTYQDNYNVTVNVEKCISTYGGADFVAHVEKGYNNTVSNSNTTVNIKDSFVRNSNAALPLVSSNQNAKINTTNSSAITSNSKLMSRMKNTGFDTNIWDLSGTSPNIRVKSYYNLDIYDSSTGKAIVNTTLNANSTIQDVIDKLKPYGSVSLSDGVLTFSGYNGAVLGGGIADMFGIEVVNTATGGRYIESCSVLTLSTGATATGDTILNTLIGLSLSTNLSLSVTVVSNGTQQSFRISSRSNINALISKLNSYGINAGLTDDGKFYIEEGENYIANMNIFLSSGLKIPNTNNIKYDSNNSVGKQIKYNTITTITTQSTFEDLGLSPWNVSPSVTIKDANGNSTSLTFRSSSTIDDVFTALAAFDIHCSITSDGKVTLTPAGSSYISGANSQFLNYLHLDSFSTSTKVTDKYANTASNTLKEEKTCTITSSTTLGELGLDGTSLYVATPDCNIVLDADGNLDLDTTTAPPDVLSKISIQDFDKNNTLGDIFTWLASHNISASIYSGNIVINDENGILGQENVDRNILLVAKDGSSDFLQRLALSTKQADYLTTKTSTTLANTTSDELNATVTKTMKTSTTLGDLGASGTLTVSFTQEGKDTTLTFKADDTVDDMLTALAGYGISGQVVDGKISLTGNKHTHITEISADLKSALKLGDNLSYSTVITEGTTVNTDSNKQTHEDTNAKLTGDTIISSIDGFNNGNGSLIVHKTDGTYVTISVDASKTLDEFFEQISQYGIIGSVDSQGVVTITGVGNTYLQQDTNGSNILEALKLSNVVTSIKTVTVNRTSDTLSHVSTVAAKGTTTLENLQDKTGQSITFDALGKAGLILHAYSDAGNTFVTLNFSKTDTIYDVIDKLAEYGVDARLDADGRFSISSSTLTDFDLSGDLGTFLMGAYNKNYGKDTTHNVSTLLVDRTITQMTDNSKLTDFGITGGDILVNQDGTYYTVNVDMSVIKTIGDFRNLISQYGFNSFIDDSGRLNILGIGNNTLEKIDGGSNILDILGLLDWTQGEILQQSAHLTEKTDTIRKISMSDKLKDLTNSSGVNLGITAGQIYVYQDGTRSTLNIDINDTLETLAAKLSQYGISVGISQEGKLYFDGNNDSYLTTDGIITANASNILQKFDISGNWSTRYDSTSKNLNYTENEDKKVSGSTKLRDLKDTNGNNLGITTGSFYVYNSGVRNTETITDDMTVNDLMSTLAKYGLVADFDENGVMSVGAYNNTYLATSALAGDNSNIVNTLFEKWNFVNIYKSNHLDIPTDEIRAITRDTKLADINEGTYEAGYITVVKDGVKTNIELTENDTVGTLMNELALYGFESVINDKGQLMIKNTGDSLLQKYDGTGKASNALELLGIDLNNWIKTNSYDSKTLDVTSTTTKDVNASRDTLLSELGVSTGEYYIYNNGVKYTAMISSDETLGSFMDTLKSFGIETSLVDGADGSVLTIIGKGDAYLKYIKGSELKAGQSNVVEKLFGENTKEAYEYKGLEQTSSTTIIENFATEDTLVSEFNKPWNGQTLESAGDLVVEVNGQKSTIKINADETFGSLLEKFRALGLEATMSKDGQIMIQSGYDTMTILQDGTTSNLLGNINLQYKDDLGGYSASSTVLEATTSDIVEKTISVANYTNMNTKLSDLNISEGSLSIYVDGQRLYKENVIEGRTIKQSITIDKDETFTSLERKIKEYNNNSDDIVVNIDNNGFITFSSKTGKKVEVGATSDTSNFSAITGISTDESGIARSAREMYCVNGDTKLVQSNIFRRGNVTEGNFYVGLAEINITADTTLNDIINQINTSEQANATAYWDNVDGKFVIKSRKTGSALVNIEAGTSNFTDILGYTTSTWKNGAPDGNTKAESTRMNVSAQEVGDNAKIKINGTTYTSTSNTIGSDITRIKGLTINLKGHSKGETVTLKVERDKETLANAVSGVVDSYNELMKNVDEAIASDGDLKNESTLKLVRNQLRNLMTSSDAGTTVFRNLDSIGIGVAAASGNNIATTNSAIVSLAFDKDKFLKAYEADQDAVKELIIGGANNKGIFTKVEDLVESTLKSVSGYFASTETSYANKIKDLDKKITKANRDVDRYKARLEAKFQSMDMLIAQMQQQYSSFLTT